MSATMRTRAQRDRSCCQLLHEYQRLLQTAGGAETPEAAVIHSQLEERLCGHASALEHVEAALRQSEAELRQAQKMEAIGRLAGGAAHDFNNVLSVILAVSDVMLAELEPTSALRGDIELIREAGAQGARLSRQLLMFSRRQVTEPKVVNTQLVLADVEKMLRRVLGEDITLVCRVQSPAPCLKVDPGLIEQVLMNLAVNARDAMPNGGELDIDVSTVVLPAPLRPDGPAGACAVFMVSDTGIGMDATTRSRIFEPFFTTKDPGRGTGLGLSTVLGIVRQCGGSISVFSEPGKGARFIIYLPSVEPEPHASARDAEQLALGGDETILVVEDEAAVRTATASVLRRHGYDVLEASNAGEALLVCEKHPAPIHLLLTDVVMPRMNGPELASRLVKVQPGMKVLYMSGHGDGAADFATPAHPGAACLPKPLTLSALTQKVREVLGVEGLGGGRRADSAPEYRPGECAP